MTFDLALRLTEVLLGLAFLQQSLEHLVATPRERPLFAVRTLISLQLTLGIAPIAACLGLLVLSLIMLRTFDGPYNGGSDRMTILILICLTLAHIAPSTQWQHVALGYLAVQLMLSYFLSGLVKIVNPRWRSGVALCDVFRFSVYPVSQETRTWGERRRLLFVGSWAVMVFELLFPLTLLTSGTLIAGLVVAALFHFANAILFGLNRFVWAWLAAYPSLLWFQQRVFASVWY